MPIVGPAFTRQQPFTIDYQPTSRRPIADSFRKTAQGAVRFCGHHRIHPDAISYLSIVASAVAALFFWRSGETPWLLLVAPLFCYLRLWLNMLDGMVAIQSRQASARGEILNDLPDRISDVLVFTGVAHSGLGSPYAAYWAAIFALLTAYIGMLGQAVGARREFSGVMSKPWRMVLLHAGAWSTFAIRQFAPGHPLFLQPPTILDWTCIFIIAGCIQTIVVRLRRILQSLDAKARKASHE